LALAMPANNRRTSHTAITCVNGIAASDAVRITRLMRRTVASVKTPAACRQTRRGHYQVSRLGWGG